MTDSNTPNYKTWTHEQLVHVVQHYHQQVVQQHEAIEQLRRDNKDLSALLKKELAK